MTTSPTNKRDPRLSAIAARLTLTPQGEVADKPALVAWVVKKYAVTDFVALTLIAKAQRTLTAPPVDTSVLTVADAVALQRRMSNGRIPTRAAIRRAAAVGAIAGVWQDAGGHYRFLRTAYEAWLNDPAKHRRGPPPNPNAIRRQGRNLSPAKVKP